MRITQQEIDNLKKNIYKYRQGAEIFLFGSRTNDQKKGGDIDILVLDNKKLQKAEVRNIKRSFYDQFEEQKIDIISFTKNSQDLFLKYISLNAIKL